MSAVSSELKGFAKRVEIDAKSVFDTVSRAFTGEKRKRFTLSGEFSDEVSRAIGISLARPLARMGAGADQVPLPL